MPGESEDVWARAIPTYRHFGGHRYEIHPSRLDNVDVLRGAVNAHRGIFDSPAFLAKSPFNSLRIPALIALWGDTIRFVDIVRNRHDSGQSMSRNHFEFVRDGRLLSPESAWTLFVTAIERDAPPNQLLTVTHADLRADPKSTVAAVLAWLDAYTAGDSERHSADGLSS